MLKDLKKEDFIKGLKELVEHLEVNKEVDLEKFNNEVLKFAYSSELLTTEVESFQDKKISSKKFGFKTLILFG